MDRTWVSGTQDSGSIPDEGTVSHFIEKITAYTGRANLFKVDLGKAQ